MDTLQSGGGQIYLPKAAVGVESNMQKIALIDYLAVRLLKFGK